jgi:hypothetical protein
VNIVREYIYFDIHIFAYTHTNNIFCGTHRNNSKQSRRVHDNNNGENGSAGSIECVGGGTYLRHSRGHHQETQLP